MWGTFVKWTWVIAACNFAWAAITVVLLTGRCVGVASVSLATRGQRRYARVGYRRTGCSAGTFPLV